MSTQTEASYPRRGFALFAVRGAVEVRTVNVTGVHNLMDAASVTEVATGVPHVLPLARVASETTLAKKKANFAAMLSRPPLTATAGKTESMATEQSTEAKA